MIIGHYSPPMRVFALVAWTMALSLQGVMIARAQGNGTSEVPSPYRLSIGDAVGDRGASPAQERGNAFISFTLSVSVPLPGIKVAQNVMVCQARTIHVANTGGCISFSRIKPPTQVTGTIVGSFPLAGEAIKLFACENIAAPKAQRCGDTLATDEQVIPLVAQYSAGLTSVTVLHTRANSTDTTWLSWIGDTDLTRINHDACGNLLESDAPQSPFPCFIQRVGDLQDGPHSLKGFLGVDAGRLPPDSGSSSKFAFVVWNYGFDLVEDPSKLSDAMVDAAVPVLLTMSPSQQIDLTPALNDHLWGGCDGPTAGMAFKMTGAQLDQLTRATGEFRQTIGPFVVPSQVGCGASSEYLVTLIIHRDSWRLP